MAMTVDEIVQRLTEPVDARHIKTRPQGGSNIQYIEWHTACQYLDAHAPGWSWSIHSVAEVGNHVVVHGTLTIVGSDGTATRDATGVEDTTVKGYGDPVSNAHAMAFKRAAAMFGLGRHMYSKDHPVAPSGPRPVAPAANQWADALVEQIHVLQLYGISNDDIQNRMFQISGVKKRADLTNGTGIAVLRAFEEWVMLEEKKVAADGAGKDMPF